jgi:hypothetical protein
MIDKNVRSQASIASRTFKNGNNVAVATDHDFTTIKRTKAKRETSSTSTHPLK